MNNLFYPSLFQVNTRVYMTELSQNLGRKATLDDVPDSELDRLADSGFDWIWFLSVWQTGKEGQRVSREHPGWRKEFQETLFDLVEEDIEGSGFAIKSYIVSDQLGGEEALNRLRKRINDRGMKLMLDFVPNHTAIDHRWVDDNLDYYVRGTVSNLEAEPRNYKRVKSKGEDIVLAYGRDPFFLGWPDTLQLNYGNPDLQAAMMNQLVNIAGKCDGVRCDMAMLILPEVFEKTWGIPCHSFWPEAIGKVRAKFTYFCFVAEVYWDLEWTLLEQGFNYAYDKRLYDRLKRGSARTLREHLFAGLDYQSKMARFLENHDEPRVAASFPEEKHQAAATITFLTPGLRFFHHGQYVGRKLRISPHLVRAPEEPLNEKLELFYTKLLDVIRRPLCKKGNWLLLDCTKAWEDNWTNDCFISFLWQNDTDDKLLIAVNYSSVRSQCYVKLPFQNLENRIWLFKDLINGETFEREGSILSEKGLYLDEPAWKYYVFHLNSA